MKNISKVLIIRFSSIGDIVLTTPIIRCLKEQLQVEIHFLTKQSFHPVLKANPNLDKIITIKKKVSEVLNSLKEEKYDYIIDLHNNLRSWQVKLNLGVKSKAFNKLNWQKWLIVNLKWNTLPPKHIVDRYFEPVFPLGVKNDNNGLDYFIPLEEEVNLEDYPILRVENKYIAFVIGAAHATKRLPEEKIISICQKIPFPILLLGGPGEAQTGKWIASEAGQHVVNTCGALTINQSASLIRQAWKVITHDTGLMHIAAAFKKEIFSIWGNTIPEFGMYPYYPEAVSRNFTFEVKNLPCRPCSKIGNQECPKGHFDCMRKIDEQALIQKLLPEKK